MADALKSLIIAYLAAVNLSEADESKQSLIAEIQTRSAIQKGDTVEALAGAIDTEAREAHSFNTVTSMMRL